MVLTWKKWAVRSDEPGKVFLEEMAGVQFTVGQPISHRIDHMLSGTRASIAVKIFGPKMEQRRQLAEEAEAEMSKVRGVVDLAIEPIVNTAQVSFRYDREAMALHGVRPAEISGLLRLL